MKPSVVSTHKPYRPDFNDLIRTNWAAVGPNTFVEARDRSQAYEIASALNAAYQLGRADQLAELVVVRPDDLKVEK